MARMPLTYTAIDFETANRFRDSACAIGLVRVSRGRIVRRAYHLIRPPSRRFEFTHIHGLRWSDVSTAPSFGDLWPKLLPMLRGVDFIAAHWAPFDVGVLRALWRRYEIDDPGIRYKCTVRLARNVWGIRPTKLPNVARYLGIELDHHHAGSDAEACARIVMAALEEG